MNTDEITEKIIGCAYTVANELGAGFLEKVYENALCIELTGQGLQVSQQQPIVVKYHDQVVGEYFADLIVEAAVIIELKAVRSIDPVHQAQLLNYLKATGIHTGLLLNFGTPRLGIKRTVNGTDNNLTTDKSR